jgi:hypothetical protein
MQTRSTLLAAIAALALPWNLLFSTEPLRSAEPARAEVVAAMKPYAGPPAANPPAPGLVGKVMTGYQGWFNTPHDGAGLGWRHYPRRGEFRPGRASIDLWPDLDEYSDHEKFATPFRHADGRPAYVFSSHHRLTVGRHFRWMREYGIDGAFVQRFVVATAGAADLRHCNTVLANCREAANREGRAYALMYDLSGLKADGIERCIADWSLLVDRMRLGRDDSDRAYLRHAGRPVVAVWGVGFNDDRAYSLDDCRRLVEFLKDDPTYGGNTVMLGVPTGWRTLDRDAAADPALHDVLEKADIISPWTVGRFASPDDVKRHADRDWRADLSWCREQGKDYMPVAFPGFSWHNLRDGQAKLDQIPRRGGGFLWRQYVEAKRVGATMIYQAMFDELDEATAIFKCTNDPPVGESPFLTYEGLPSDHYLWLTGQGGRLLRGEIEPSDQLPSRK